MPDGQVPVVLSAETPELLRSEAAALRAYVTDHSDAGIDQIAGTMLRYRTVRPHRAVAAVSGRDDLLRLLDILLAGESDPNLVRGDGSATGRRFGFVFPGQGSQHPGMGTLFYERSTAYRTMVDDCAALLEEELAAPEPLRYLLGDETHSDRIGVVQPALFVHTVGLAAMWLAAGVTPSAAVGHSQGELAAAAICGYATLRDALVATKVRADLISEHAPGGYTMAVLGVDIDECESLIAHDIGWLKLSVVNSPHIVAISGLRPEVLRIIDTVRESGRFAKEIRVEYPAHTEIVAPYRDIAVHGVRERLFERQFADSDIPLFAATIGDRIPNGLPQAEFWFLNLRNRVRFDRATIAAADSADIFIELSDNPMLSLAIQENLSMARDERAPGADPRVVATSRRDATDLGAFTRNLLAVAVHDLNFRWDTLVDGTGTKPGPAVLPGFPKRATVESTASEDIPGWVVPPDDIRE
ncbi:acyltransferase domain-containing protein [Nocardia spumae]|uniref:acyltransferase domain-containing protein n=1 Tax=Nocardia spumae TaxID=2887190 RepID=UPI001D13D8DC|nr:acyltransferase domain-containing protein [Nocardia spumae]